MGYSINGGSSVENRFEPLLIKMWTDTSEANKVEELLAYAKLEGRV